MGWRGVYISRAAHLGLKQGQLQVGNDGSVPLEDVDFLVLDTQHTTLTGSLLAACASQGCAVITADEKHMPNGVLLGFHPYHRQAETVQAQLGLALPRKKRLWQQLIRAKVANQALCLKKLGHNSAEVAKVHLYVNKVHSGDGDNAEATAARLYWSLYSPGFKRHSADEDRLNALLNYGYAVLRAVLARDLAALGFIPCLGIHHCNIQNPFNLADDLMEPWRAFVDCLAYSLWREEPQITELRPVDKQRMVGLIQQDISLAGEVSPMLSAMRSFVAQVRAYMLGQNNTLDCPTFTLTQGSPCPQTEHDTCA